MVGDEASVWRRVFAALLGVTVLRDLLSVHVPAMSLRPPDAFRLPWLSALPIVERTAETLLLAHVALAVMSAAAAWMVLRPAGRWAPLALLVGYGAAFLADQRHYTSNQYLLLWCLALVVVWGAREPAPAWPRLALRLLFSAVYVAAVITKIDPAWFDGLVIRESLLNYGPVWGAIDAAVPAAAYPVAAWATVVVEAFLAVGLWVRPLRRWAIGLGVALHVGIEIVMPVRCFSYLMLAGYALYLDADAVPRPRREPAWRWLGAGLGFALAVAALGWACDLYPLPPVNLAAVGAGVLVAVGLGRRPVAERPAAGARPALRAVAFGGLVLLHAALLAKPYLGGDDRFAFRMFREIVVVQAETRARIDGRWRQYPMVGATEYWFAGAPGYYWESWREHRDFLQGYADWILGASGAEDVRVVARYRINDGPVQQAVFAPRAE